MDNSGSRKMGINEISTVRVHLLQLSGIQGHGSRRGSRQNPADAFIRSEGLEITRQGKLSELSLQDKGKLPRESQRIAGSSPECLADE